MVRFERIRCGQIRLWAVLFMHLAACRQILGLDKNELSTSQTHMDVKAADGGTDGAVDGGLLDGAQHDAGHPHDGGSEDAQVEDAAHFYVDVSFAKAGDGLKPETPFKTISAALAVARASVAKSRIVHVAKGTYSQRTGETFPLDLRGHISLLGASRDEVVVQGVGDLAAHNGFAAEDLGILTGDAEGMVTISSLTIASGLTDRTGTGIECTEGNAPLLNDEWGAPTLALDDIAFAGDLTQDLLIVTRVGAARGCNVRVTRSRFAGTNGILVPGWGNSGGIAPGAVRVGDGTPEGGNTFVDLSNAAGDAGAGLWVETNFVRVQVLNNTFSGGSYGVTLAASDHVAAYHVSPNAQVSGNVFRGQKVAGVWIYGEAQILELSGNSFSEISAPQPSELASAIRVESNLDGSYEPPAILTARDNRIIGNDVGIQLRGSVALGLPLGFGTKDKPGGNTFSCNSKAGAVGADVWITPSADGLTLLGNSWDHAAPTVRQADVAEDGTDVVLGAGVSTPPLGEGPASQEQCPEAHIAGP